jgi:hypothetical protein
MDADERRLELDKITDCILGCAYKIGNKLVYNNIVVGAYIADFKSAFIGVNRRLPLLFSRLIAR